MKLFIFEYSHVINILDGHNHYCLFLHKKEKVFRGYFTSHRNVIVTRGGVVKYRNRVIVVEHKGKILHRFWPVRKLQVYNRIEGYLNFVGSSSPSGRVFPGYGELMHVASYHS